MVSQNSVLEHILVVFLFNFEFKVRNIIKNKKKTIRVSIELNCQFVKAGSVKFFDMTNNNSTFCNFDNFIRN